MRSIVLLCLVVPMAVPSVLDAQIRASERGWVGQRIDGTNITIAYGRPKVRGRTLFGGVVPYGEVWTPGANWASTFETDRDVIIEGTDVPAGAYSLWIVAQEGDRWTLHLNGEAKRFHTNRPEPDEMAVSIPVTREDAEPYEALTFHFPDFRRDGATVHFHWGTNQIALDIRVHPSATGTLTAEQIAPYLGSYDFEMFGEGPDPIRFPVEMIDAQGKLRGIVDDGEFAFQLIPSAEEEGTFYFGFLQGGEVVDVEEGPVHFRWEDGRVTGVTIYGIGIDIWMEGVKTEP